MTQPNNNQQFYDRDGLPVDMAQPQQYANQPYPGQQYQASPYQAPQFPQPGHPAPQQHQGPVQQKLWLATRRTASEDFSAAMLKVALALAL